LATKSVTLPVFTLYTYRPHAIILLGVILRFLPILAEGFRTDQFTSFNPPHGKK